MLYFCKQYVLSTMLCLLLNSWKLPKDAEHPTLPGKGHVAEL